MATMLENQAKELPVEKPKKGYKNDAFAVSRQFMNESLRLCSGAEAKVWFILWNMTDRNKKTYLVHVSYKKIEELAGISHQSAIDSVKILELKGLLVKVAKGSSYTKESNVYRIKAVKD